jgi:hypothetical protein
MKTIGKILGGIVVLLILLLAGASITGLDPSNQRPGLWLKGDLVTGPVTDWSFTDKFRTIEIQTNTPFLIPHSVTTNFVIYNNQFYVDSIYPKGIPYPHGRRWHENVARDPHVRLKIGNQLFDRQLVLVTDPMEVAAVNEIKAKKYPNLAGEMTNSTITVFRAIDN